MPNWVYNRMYFIDESEAKKFYESCQKDGEFSTKFGREVRHAFQTTLFENMISFETKWSEPEDFYDWVRENHNGPPIEVEWLEEQGWGGSVTISGGQFEDRIHWDYPEFSLVYHAFGWAIYLYENENPEYAGAAGYYLDRVPYDFDEQRNEIYDVEDLSYNSYGPFKSLEEAKAHIKLALKEQLGKVAR